MVIKGSLRDVRRVILDLREAHVKTKAASTAQNVGTIENLRETTEYKQLNEDCLGATICRSNLSMLPSMCVWQAECREPK
jgi:hypothetical protein